MKLTSTLKLRPDFLYLAPLLNVVILLLIFFLVNSSLVVQGGSRIELPLSPSSLRAMERAHVVAIPAGDEAEIYFNRKKTTLAELPNLLKKERAKCRQVIVSADALVSHGRVMDIQNMIWAAGCQPAVASRLPE